MTYAITLHNSDNCSVVSPSYTNKARAIKTAKAIVKDKSLDMGHYLECGGIEDYDLVMVEDENGNEKFSSRLKK